MRAENVDILSQTPISAKNADHILLSYLDRIASALEGKAEREERLIRAMESQAESLRRLADFFAPDPTKIVGTPYVRKKLGLKTTQAVRDRIKAGQIPKPCIVRGSGSGTPWKFHRDKIDALAG